MSNIDCLGVHGSDRGRGRHEKAAVEGTADLQDAFAVYGISIGESMSRRVSDLLAETNWLPKIDRSMSMIVSPSTGPAAKISNPPIILKGARQPSRAIM